MKILFLGPYTGTSRHRADALTRLGHQVHVVTPEVFVSPVKIIDKFHYETGGLFCAQRVAAGVLNAVQGLSFDLTWVEQGRYVGDVLVRELQQRFGPVINYNNDDPLGYRDRLSWMLYKRALPVYDLLIFHREVNVREACALGARRAACYFSVIDEVAHAPRSISPEDYQKWSSDVLFLGTWMPERGPFMQKLIENNVPLTIYGNRWEKAWEWPVIRKYWKGPATTNYDDYARAIQCSKICLGLLSKGNRDLHTRRSMEVPSLGGLLCAERTTDHQALYKDGEEAILWSDADDCAKQCFDLLQDEPRRLQIASRGRERCVKNGNYNEPFLTKVLQLLQQPEGLRSNLL